MNTIYAACTSNIGKIRSNNEDNLYFFGRYMTMENHGIDHIVCEKSPMNQIQALGVFDGVGGESQGERASYLAVSSFHERINWARKNFIIDIEEFIEDTCMGINTIICQESKKYECNMATTAAILVFDENKAYACNLGDSPIFCLRDGKLKKITKEQTQEVEGSTHKPVLTQWLGMSQEKRTLIPYIAKGTAKVGDCYLICSDGLSDMLTEQEMTQILLHYPDVEQCVQVLLEEAIEHGGRDNITIILAKIEE